MAKLKKIFLFFVFSTLSIAFAYFSIITASLPLGYASLFCFALATHAFMGMFKKLHPYRWSIPLLIAVTTCYSYRKVVIQSIDPELAALVGSSTDCATINVNLAGGMGGMAGRLIQESQNVCYLTHIRENLKPYPADQQIEGVYKTAEAMKRQKRLNPTSLTLLVAMDVMARMQQKKIAMDKSQVQLGLTEDILRLVELYPKSSESPPQDPDELLVYNLDREMEHRALTGIMRQVKKSFVSYEEHAPMRDPASANPITPLQQRLGAAQQNWKISDEDLSRPQK